MFSNVFEKISRRASATASLRPPNEPPKLQGKKMKWGEPTWFLFHTLAEKVKEEDFELIRTELLQNIHTICANLPCPICAEHAKEYLASTNFQATVRTRDQLKEFFFNFHNVVNKRKNFPIFNRAELDRKYASANLNNIIAYFFQFYTDNSRVASMMTNDMYRKRVVRNLDNWFRNNFHHFNL